MPTDNPTTSSTSSLSKETDTLDDLEGTLSGDEADNSQVAVELPDDPQVLKNLVIDARKRQAGVHKKLSEIQRQLESEKAERFKAEGRATAAFRQPQQQQQIPAEAKQEPILTAQEIKRLREAELQDDYDTIANFEELKATRIAKRSQDEVLRQIIEAARIAGTQQNQQAALNSFLQSQGVQDINSPVGHLLTEKVQALARGERADVVSLSGGNQNTALAILALEAKNEISTKEGALRSKRQPEPTEDSGGGSPGTPGRSVSQSFNYMQHLTEAERKYSHMDGKVDHKKTWELLEKRFPGMQRARLEAGRPLSSAELKFGGKK